MTMPLTHRERLQACLADDPALDRPPIALWRHFPVDDQSPETLAAATLHFQRSYDFDLVKVTPASSFCLKDWGAEDAWEGHSEGTRRYTKRVIQTPQDWERLPVLDPSAPHLAGQLACLRLIKRGLDPETPLLQTIFSPLAQAKNLAGGETLIAHLRQYPDSVMMGLATIAATTSRFVAAAIETGIDGIFYAIQHAQASLLTLDEYKSFGLHFDLQTLQPATALWCNLLHLHGLNIYFDLIPFFPDHLFPIVNWHDRETPPSLREAKTSEFFENSEVCPALCGGISQKSIVFGSSSEVQKEAADAIQQTKGRGFILGTGCVVPVIAPHGNIVTARQSVEEENVMRKA
ncbi:MAG: uroporphyrinogen decarboxylase family protein [Anaerolineales bacterium]|nr:uroporphyrinogen decarboxylase family protein [Anaerolineales bacterium]